MRGARRSAQPLGVTIMDHLRAIRDKLSRDEVDFLKRKFGVDISSPDLEEQIAAVAELETMSRKVEEIQGRAAMNERARLVGHPQCAFCGGSTTEVGPLAQSRRGVSICCSCAQACIASIDEERRSDA